MPTKHKFEKKDTNKQYWVISKIWNTLGKSGLKINIILKVIFLDEYDKKYNRSVSNI